jgi:hypothetical protein
LYLKQHRRQRVVLREAVGEGRFGWGWAKAASQFAIP